MVGFSGHIHFLWRCPIVVICAEGKKKWTKCYHYTFRWSSCPAIPCLQTLPPQHATEDAPRMLQCNPITPHSILNEMNLSPPYSTSFKPFQSKCHQMSTPQYQYFSRYFAWYVHNPTALRKCIFIWRWYCDCNFCAWAYVRLFWIFLLSLPKIIRTLMNDSVFRIQNPWHATKTLFESYWLILLSEQNLYNVFILVLIYWLSRKGRHFADDFYKAFFPRWCFVLWFTQLTTIRYLRSDEIHVPGLHLDNI